MGLNVYVSEVYEQLNGMTAALNRTIDKLSDYLSSVEDFVNDTVLKGVSYDSMKTYFGEVHAPWAKGMIAACEAMIEANNAYINTFVEMVDASGTDIIEEDIRYMMMRLSNSINNFQAINQAAGEEVVDTWHLEQLEAEHQRLLERLYDFDYSTADYYNYAQSLIEAAKQGGSLMGNSWDASTSTFLNPAMLNMEWRPLVDSAWEKLSEEYILFRGKYVHARRKLEQYWNRQDGYFEGFWWQDIEKMKEAYRMLDLEITQKGGIKIHDLITSEYAEDQLKMYALQSLSNAPRTGTYDLEFLHSLENMYLKAGLDYSETDHTIDKKGLEALKECYKNIKLKKSGDWLERGGGDIIAGVTLIAGGMVMSRAGNRSLKIRSEGIGNAGSGKTYNIKRGPKIQSKGLSDKGGSGAKTNISGKGAYNGKVTDGEGFGKLAGKEITPSSKGVDMVKNHIKNNGFDAPENTKMINRIESALKNGEKLTGADASFYMHEIKERTLMNGGMSYNQAHQVSLETYGVSPFSVYHPEVIWEQPSAWGKPWFDFWGIEK
jgi:hypothetical protein